jgi:hypothetical protein
MFRKIPQIRIHSFRIGEIFLRDWEYFAIVIDHFGHVSSLILSYFQNLVDIFKNTRKFDCSV